jgi:ADP-ribose pyrophosphatase YjhB (NUDIX family)
MNAMASRAQETTISKHPMPFTRIELVLLGIVGHRLHVLLARRAEAPYPGRWALPGGVLRVDLDRSLEEAAARVAGERLGLDGLLFRQVAAIGGPTRDPRAPWALSIVFRALVVAEALSPVAGKRVEALEWRDADVASADERLAFDHNQLVAQAVTAARHEIDVLELPLQLLPTQFTLGELQAVCEEVLGRPLDKSSFRRRLADRDLVEPIEGAQRIGPFRPAQLYSRRPS